MVSVACARFARTVVMADLRACQSRFQSLSTNLLQVSRMELVAALRISHCIRTAHGPADVDVPVDMALSTSEKEARVTHGLINKVKKLSKKKQKNKKKHLSPEAVRIMELCKEIQTFSQKRARSAFTLYLHQCNQQQLQGDLPLREFFWQCRREYKLLDSEVVAEFVRQAAKEREEVMAANTAFEEKCEELKKLRIVVQERKRKEVLKDVFAESTASTADDTELIHSPKDTVVKDSCDQPVDPPHEVTLAGVFDEPIPSIENLVGEDQPQLHLEKGLVNMFTADSNHLDGAQFNFNLYEDHL